MKLSPPVTQADMNEVLRAFGVIARMLKRMQPEGFMETHALKAMKVTFSKVGWFVDIHAGTKL